MSIKNLNDTFFNEIGKLKKLSKEAQSVIEKIQEEIKKLDFNDIEYIKDDNYNFTMKYNSNIRDLITEFKNIIEQIDNEKILYNIFGKGSREFELQIKLHSNEFNRIEILNGLPYFMRDFGLGKKIYKKLIYDFNYISSLSGYEHTRDSEKVWYSIASKERDLYIFVNNDEDFICFSEKYSFDNIVEVLKEFFKNSVGKIAFDDDFLKRYGFDDDSFKSVLGTF